MREYQKYTKWPFLVTSQNIQYCKSYLSACNIALENIKTVSQFQIDGHTLIAILLWLAIVANYQLKMGQWDLNPRPPAPQAYTSTELVSLTKLDDGPSKSENKGLLLNLKNA